jgi:tellurium resistance protein TerD
VSLDKGGTVSLSREAPGLTAVDVGLGWDVRSTSGSGFDLDASAILATAEGRVARDEDFVFYNNRASPDGSVEHSGDNRNGVGPGDDEAIRVNLAAVPPEVQRIVVVVSVYRGEDGGQNFGQVRNAFIRVVNRASGQEIARYDLSEDAALDTAVVFGELYRFGGEWKFRAIGEGYRTGLRGIAADFGVDV